MTGVQGSHCFEIGWVVVNLDCGCLGFGLERGLWEVTGASVCPGLEACPAVLTPVWLGWAEGPEETGVERLGDRH